MACVPIFSWRMILTTLAGHSEGAALRSHLLTHSCAGLSSGPGAVPRGGFSAAPCSAERRGHS